MLTSCGFLESGRLLGRYCGSTLPAPLETSDSFAYVRFVSDASGNSAGFSLSFEASVEGAVTHHTSLSSNIGTCYYWNTPVVTPLSGFKMQRSPDVCLPLRHSLRRRAKRSLWNYFFTKLPQLVPAQPGVSLGDCRACWSASYAHHQ